MSLPHNCASLVDMMINDYRVRKDIVGSGDDHFAVFNRYWPGKSEENHENFSDDSH